MSSAFDIANVTALRTMPGGRAAMMSKTTKTTKTA
jgi:hypothetical protein